MLTTLSEVFMGIIVLAQVKETRMSWSVVLLAVLTFVFMLTGCSKYVTVAPLDKSLPIITVKHNNGEKWTTIDYGDTVSGGLKWAEGSSRSEDIVVCQGRDKESGVKSAKITTTIGAVCEKGREKFEQYFYEDNIINNSAPDENGKVPVEFQVTTAFNPGEWKGSHRDCGDGFVLTAVEIYHLECRVVNYNDLESWRHLYIDERK